LLRIYDSLEEVFENKEQIEVMKKSKPHALAVQEWLDGKIYYRDSNKSTMSVLSGKKYY
jgi:hypothetical protein